MEAGIFDRRHGDGNSRFSRLACYRSVEDKRVRSRSCSNSLAISDFDLADSRFSFEVVEESISSDFEMEIPHPSKMCLSRLFIDRKM